MQSNQLIGCFASSLYLAFFTSCIHILPPPLKDDGFTNYIQAIKKDTISKIENLPTTLLSDDEGKVYEVDNVFIDSMCLKYEKLWVIMWAVWCPSCTAYMEGEIKHAKENNIKLMLVSSNYDIVHIKKQYQRSGYAGNIYIIKSSVYSNKRVKRLRNSQINCIKQIAILFGCHSIFFIKKES